MTNHWTRFFPLVKYVRKAFLRSGTSDGRAFETTATTSNTNNHQTTTRQQKHEYNLGRVLSMHGDFSFVTPVDPSDRYLNHTLGGGVTMDVGCYLVELALLAAYEHEQSHQPPLYESSTSLKQHLRPDDIVATGHGVYRGVSFPVDVESSFSLRWSGGSYGISPSCDGVASDTTNDRKCVATSIGGKSFVQNKIQSTSNEFTMVASFQTSFRRPSTFGVVYTFERGRILINGPANAPNEMTIFEHAEFGPLIRETKVTFPLPEIKQELLQFGRPNYPRPEGFAYVIDAIEKCMAEKGVPGRKGDKPGGCLELEENTVEEQLVTVGKFPLNVDNTYTSSLDHAHNKWSYFFISCRGNREGIG